MKNTMKIIIAAIAIFLCIGIVCAAEYNQIFTAPSGLHAIGNNDFVDEQGHNIMILEYTDDFKQTWFENDTNPAYLVQPYNDTCYLGVTDENDCYLLEIVEKDNTKYIIGSWTPNGAEDTPIIQNNLLEFNKLNQLTPLLIED